MKTALLSVALLLALCGAASAEPTRLATEGAYPPYNYVDDSGMVGGYDVDVGNEICRRTHLDCTWVVVEWDSLIPNLLSGNFDAIIASMTITPEREKTIDFTLQYFPADPSTFMLPAGKSYDFDNLRDARIGVQNATVQADHVTAVWGANNQVKKYADADQALADLVAGNIDMVFAEKTYVGDTVAGSAGALVMAGPEIGLGNGNGIGFRKADTELRAQFDAALAAMKADGTLDALIARYFPGKPGAPFYR
jgi:polar amino acid transport system substrate-binding protein